MVLLSLLLLWLRQDALVVKAQQLRKFFKTGDHVKVIAGQYDGETGMVVKVEGQVAIVISDTTRDHVRLPFPHHWLEECPLLTEQEAPSSLRATDSPPMLGWWLRRSHKASCSSGVSGSMGRGALAWRLTLANVQVRPSLASG